MAIGFIPKYTEVFTIESLSREQTLALATKTAEKLGWKLSYLSLGGLKANTDHGVFKWNAEITVKLADGSFTVRSESSGNDMIDFGKNKKNVLAYKHQFDELKSKYSHEELMHEFYLLENALVPKTEDELSMPERSKAQQIKDFFSLFWPRRAFFSTPLIIDLNILVFVLMALSGAGIFSPDGEELVKWGGNFGPRTLHGEAWRLLSCCFVHIGVVHLLFNMYALLYIGILLEPILGSLRFIITYLLTGIVASLTSLWWHQDPVVSAGASGAIFGMYGIFFAFLTGNLIERNSNQSLLMSIAAFVGYNLLFGLSIGADNSAHLGGLISGFLIGYALIPGLRRPENRYLNIGSIAGISVFFLLLSGFVYVRLPNNLNIYEQKLQEFAVLEEEALSIYDMPPETPMDTALSVIQRKGIDNWKKSIMIFDDLRSLDLPDTYMEKNLLLRKYCSLRLRSYELTYEKLSGNTHTSQQAIDSCNQQIADVMKMLNNKEPSATDN